MHRTFYSFLAGLTGMKAKEVLSCTVGTGRVYCTVGAGILREWDVPFWMNGGNQLGTTAVK